MAIVKTNPADWRNATMLRIDSDAPSNRDALLEIIGWGNQHGFLLPPDNWLERLATEENTIFRGVCYSAKRVEEEGWATILER